jgi:hypothetical protein
MQSFTSNERSSSKKFINPSLDSVIDHQNNYETSTNKAISALEDININNCKFISEDTRKFKNLGGMTPNGNNYVNLLNSTLMLEPTQNEQECKDFIIESAHIHQPFN